MGKTALPLVLSQLTVVAPKGGQPAYVRSKRSITTSTRLAKYRSCVAAGMKGQKGGGREGVQSKFAAVAKKCAGK